MEREMLKKEAAFFFWLRRPFQLASETPVSAAALTYTVAILALGALVFTGYAAIFKPDPFVIRPRTTRFFGPHQISTHLSLIVPFFDARGQTLAHLAMVGATAFTALVGAFLGPPRAALRPGWLAGLGVAVAGLLSYLYAPGPEERFLFAALPLGYLLLRAGRSKPQSWPNTTLGAVTILAVAVAILPGFFRPPDFSGYSPYELTFGEAHWSLVVGPSDLLARGSKLLEERPEYGVILPVLWASGQRAFRPFSMGDSVRLLIGLQAVYVAVSAWVVWRAARGRWLFAAVALAGVVPWYHFAHQSLLFPNQSAWRVVAMPLALAALWLIPARRPRRQSLWLGAVGGGALLLNPELGAAVTIGLAVFLFFRHRASLDQRQLATLAAPFLGGLLLAGVAFVLLCWLSLGDLVPLGFLAQAFLHKAAFLTSTGFSGFRWQQDPWPILIFGHAVFVLLQCAFTPPAAASGFLPSFRAAAAAMLLVWFAYYANRPDPWNLSSYYLLFGLLLVDLLRYVALSVSRRRASARLLAAVVLLVVLVLPNILAMAAKGAEEVRVALGPVLRRETPANATLLSGIFLERTGAQGLSSRADYIRARSGEPIVYLTADSYLMPKLSGVFSAMPAIDFCWESLTRASYERTLNAIVRSSSRRIYFDASNTAEPFVSPSLPKFDQLCGPFYRYVRRDLQDTFEYTRTEHGWEVWTRRSRTSGPGGG